MLVLGGATASGKTDLAIALAQQYDAEIIGADSRQIYRGMPVGTAAPAPEQLAAVPHHLVGFLDPFERYSAARFAADATALAGAIHARGRNAIVVGGTGFYLRALTGAVSLSAAYDERLRERLAREARSHEPEFLHAWLASRDPARAAALDPKDTYRIVRALEVALASPEGMHRPGELQTLASANIPFAKYFLDVPLHDLDARIELRTDEMLRSGLIEEAERIGGDAVAASAVGYPQALAYLDGRSTREELRALLARATRRYARRQRSWFRSEPGALWLDRAGIEAAAREKLGSP
ncbi:MAG TPA: tRNA (adenosine(37)-N6)-dimethylallyltransferase MiaA [Candidatus Baltobacteraceae bacterium]|nr:tRNA (adenosine(37)-N6)-dimethylallyltransferase MiaA [Candidatus Baltobacteraceae bacterium]